MTEMAATWTVAFGVILLICLVILAALILWAITKD